MENVCSHLFICRLLSVCPPFNNDIQHIEDENFRREWSHKGLERAESYENKNQLIPGLGKFVNCMSSHVEEHHQANGPNNHLWKGAPDGSSLARLAKTTTKPFKPPIKALGRTTSLVNNYLIL